MDVFKSWEGWIFFDFHRGLKKFVCKFLGGRFGRVFFILGIMVVLKSGEVWRFSDLHKGLRKFVPPFLVGRFGGF